LCSDIPAAFQLVLLPLLGLVLVLVPALLLEPADWNTGLLLVVLVLLKGCLLAVGHLQRGLRTSPTGPASSACACLTDNA
jgi:hypothetical protein